MSNDRRRDAATVTVGALGTAGGGLLRHQAAQQLIEARGKAPRIHGLAILRHGTKPIKRRYGAGLAIGALAAPSLAVGSARLVRSDKVEKKDRPSFWAEGIRGSSSALGERADTFKQKAPLKARAAGLGTNMAAGGIGSVTARALMGGTAGRTKAIVTPVAGVLTAAGSMPLSSRVVQRVTPGYEVTSSGVKRSRTVAKKPSTASYKEHSNPRSFRSDIYKAESSGKYRAKVTGAAMIPGVSYGTQAWAAGAGAKSPKDSRRAAGKQAGSAVSGDLLGGLAGMHGAAALAHHSPKFRAGAEKFGSEVDQAKAAVRRSVGLSPKVDKPLKPARFGVAGRAVRRATSPLRGKYGAAAATGGLVGAMAGGNIAQQLAISHNYKRHIAKGVIATDLTRPEQQKLLRRRTRNAALSTTNAAVGTAGLGAFAASRMHRFAASKPKLEAATLGLGAVGGGLGALGGFQGASIARRDIRGQKKALVSKIAVRVGYHGTDARSAKKIMGRGFQNRNFGGTGVHAPDVRGSGVYLANRDIAQFYARNASKMKGTRRPGRVLQVGVVGPGVDTSITRYGLDGYRGVKYNADQVVSVRKSMPDQSALHVPAGLRKTKSYTASSLRRTPNGQLIRVTAGMR